MFTRRLIVADQASVFMAMTSVQRSSSLVLHQMTSDHNRSELGIQDHSNEHIAEDNRWQYAPASEECITKTHNALIVFRANENQVKFSSRTHYIFTTLIELHLVTAVDAIALWIDSDATTHICKDRCWFKTYEPVEDGSVLYMGDDHFAPVHGKGSVVLEFSSGKSITLFNVLYVLKLRFGCYNNGMFMLNLNKVPDDSDSVYIAVVRLPDPKRKTLGEKGIDCIFVGYAEHSKAYRPKDIIPNSDESQRDDHSDDVPSEIPEPRKVEGSKDQVGSQYSYCYSIEEDPKTYNEAMQSRDDAF
ncbi:hypothetical protein Tco_0642264 [Tanacetum coccineum]